MTRLLDALDRFRRPPALVAWGGRPGIDRQLGSRADRRELERELILARLRRDSERRIEALARGMRAAGVAFTIRLEGAARFAEAMRKVGVTIEAAEREQRRRAALTRAASVEAAQIELRRQMRAGRLR